LVVDEDKEKIIKAMERKLKGKDQGKPGYYRIKRKDGKIVKIEIISRRIEFDGKPAILSCIRVIDER
ncbi:MAG: PAS domain S-box protein, partial [Thermoplasmata archaeon]|nr:PAS domain S-box protein [Thermoplasmata archaeon]